jgi:hypothetical protein
VAMTLKFPDEEQIWDWFVVAEKIPEKELR